MISKVNAGKFSYQYGYDLINRLASANITRKEGLQDVTITSSYTYNTAGIRTRAEQTINGVTQNRYFLLDSGHTGYAQVFEETSTLGGNLVRSYVLGDDVLSQNVGGVTSHLLYDGHGSTRQLTGDDGAVTANYAYDAYGKMLGGNPNVTDRQSATDLLYAGEQFDPGLQMEYLRARYYDQDNGRFNRLDPFDGNSEDPQSLHKYAYAHCDPVNGIDPSGELGLLDVLSVMTIMTTTISVGMGPVAKIYTSSKSLLNLVDVSMMLADSNLDLITVLEIRNILLRMAIQDMVAINSALGEFANNFMLEATYLLVGAVTLKAIFGILKGGYHLYRSSRAIAQTADNAGISFAKLATKYEPKLLSYSGTQAKHHIFPQKFRKIFESKG